MAVNWQSVELVREGAPVRDLYLCGGGIGGILRSQEFLEGRGLTMDGRAESDGDQHGKTDGRKVKSGPGRKGAFH